MTILELNEIFNRIEKLHEKAEIADKYQKREINCFLKKIKRELEIIEVENDKLSQHELHGLYGDMILG